MQFRLVYAVGDVKLSTPVSRLEATTSFKAMLNYLQPSVRRLSIHVVIYLDIHSTIAHCRLVVSVVSVSLMELK
ncbi:hypothetical protein RchiOBHm_Chr3g0495691 [Rosa chinensis]|uniref:Uncharacterized protein n=1 Tax=Rosa chinensis TaxID=74649 RepID=A0A2P6RHB3_ROSCH|nr:hypothetical protein RchiOBHm_Chr3g0495691 [Rosa chinensis]